MTLDELEQKRGEKLDREIDTLCSEIEQLIGVKIGCGEVFIPQGTNSLLHNCDQVTNYNKFPYQVDNGLIVDEWIPCEAIPLDKNYFQNRTSFLEKTKGQKIKEVKSHYFKTGGKVIVFYCKD